ncbi:MAG: hypothetical protein AB7H93_04440 [Vicinamibacterales bacterium]
MTHQAWPRLSRRIALTSLAACLAFGAGLAAQSPAPAAGDRVRVPSSHANIHKGPNTTTEVLVLAPRDTLLAVLARDKEWVQVRLTPDLRKTGLLMRWYKNEDRGWMHDSTVVGVK